MASEHGSPGTNDGLEARLERGEVIYYPTCPFPMPEGDDRTFLNTQTLAHRGHKNISYDPSNGRAHGFLHESSAQADRLTGILAGFSAAATNWLGRTLARYRTTWLLDRVSFRPAEEATRVLRQKARNDLLHVDAFPSRPTNGYRILRLFVNTNITEPRIWVTSDPFAKLLARYGAEAGLPTRQSLRVFERLQQGMLRLFQPNRPRRSAYDSFMLRFHDYLKAHDDFQERGPKRFWTFPPGSCWLAMTDTASHAVLRGRSALEHSYFIAPEAQALPEESPAALLARACGMPVLDRAA